MSRLEEIINDEFGTVTVERLDPYNQIVEIYKKYISSEMSSEDAESLASCIYESRYNSFSQGFLRGIAAVKGGVV